MNYQEWLTTVPPEITQDPLWKLEVYRLGLFVAEIGWEDVVILSKNNLTRDAADQIVRSLNSISANIAEGYSRSTVRTALVISSMHSARRVKREIGISRPAES